ncbi:hypothetical protein [Nitrospirillum pindoramense]|uniref:Cytochrome c domain-containing protein n=1 Tax=Nitrospirillum amazonense TaxID=28077 RepID=A0A560H1Q5_9PROT|nr:hypothetical protein [Nitrospirillum amazonense]TWB39729.1 hypothetical protein FBZ90_110194 [Nitrospirillum amazonense]
MRVHSSTATLAVLLGIGLMPTAAMAQIVPVDIPASYAIGTQGATLQGWVTNNNQDQLRQHSWTVWAGLNAASGTTYDGKELPVWETWLGTEEVFATPQSKLTASGGDKMAEPARHFRRPHQFAHLALLRGNALPNDPASSTQVVSFNKFSPAAAKFIRSPQYIAGLQGTYEVNSQTALNKINAAWPSGTPTENRSISEFPVEALELKPVMSVVKASGLTPMPLWQGPAQSTDAKNPTPETWKVCVAIDPAATGDEIIPAGKKLSKEQIAALDASAKAAKLSCTVQYYAPVTVLYNFKLTEEEAQSLSKAQQVKAAAGDYGVLVAMHVNTKEVPFWAWQTFYWQPGADTPNKYPGSKQGQPASLPAPYRNYAMCTNYSQQVPAVAASGQKQKMDVCFNPYLETDPGIPDGIQSNCISCHALAGVGKGPTYPANYKQPINLFADKQYFTDQATRADFSWAIADAPK